MDSFAGVFARVDSRTLAEILTLKFVLQALDMHVQCKLLFNILIAWILKELFE